MWSIPLRTLPADESVRLAERLHAAGFGTLWVPGGPDASLPQRLRVLLEAGAHIASGVLVTWRHPTGEVAKLVQSLSEEQRARFVLGVGISHREQHAAAGERPVAQMRAYLDELRDVLGAARPTTVVGALGPEMTRVAGAHADGVHPYLVTPVHTERTRRLIGDAVLAPEQAVVLERDPSVARSLAREHLHLYLQRVNYRRSWSRLGFREQDLEHGGSDRLVDALVAWGDDDSISRRVGEHLDAGADHVAVQVLNPPGQSVDAVPWERLAAALPSSES